LITPSLKKKFKFIEGNSIQKQLVGVTCETCSVQNCLERASPPIHLNQILRNEKTDATVQKYMAKYS
jgi:predicted transcriptional regulator